MASPYLNKVAPNYPAPTLDGNNVPQDWTPTSVARAEWGRIAVVMDFQDRTYFRDVHTQVENYQSLDPFGDGPAMIYFPQVTPWDDVSALFPMGTQADIYRITPGEAQGVHLWAGTVVGYEDRDVGVGIECNGSFFDLDRFLAQPDFATDDGLGTRDTGEHIVDRVNKVISTYTAGIYPMAAQATGIIQRNPGAFEPLVTGWCKELLSKAQTASNPANTPLTDTVMWTIECEGRQPSLTTRSWTANMHTYRAGIPGVKTRLKEDYLGTPSAIYGHGTGESNCVWHNTKWPNNRIEPPPAFGGTLTAGSSGAYVDRVKEELIQLGFGSGLSPVGSALVSSDFVDGPIGWFKIANGSVWSWAGLVAWTQFDAQDHQALFGSHGIAALGAPFYLPIYQDTRTKRYKYDASGVNTGANSNYDPSLPRIEHFVDYGKSNKFAAAIEARRKIEMYSEPGHLGTIEVSVDPVSSTAPGFAGSRLEIRAGDNVNLVGYRDNAGTSNRTLHVSRVEHDPQDGRTVMTVDEQVRDYLSIQKIWERDQQAKADPAARIRTELATSRIREDRMPPWDCEAGSGVIPRTAVRFGAFTVIRFPAARFGQIAHMKLRTVDASGNLLPTVFVFAIWGRAVTPDQVMVAATDGTGSVNEVDWNGILPYWPEASGGGPTALVYAAGSSTRACGWWPNQPGDHNDPTVALPPGGDDNVGPVTGEYRDSGSWEFYSQDPPWLWLSVLPLSEGYVEGQLFFSDVQPTDGLTWSPPLP